jgi:hypothetical protein
MGYGRALLQRDVMQEESALQKKAKKKGLWGSIGRTIGSLGAMAISGGTLNPVTVGLLSGGASFLGGAVGAGLSQTGDLRKGKFFKSDRESLQKELGGFGSKNIVEALKGGVTAGIGQATKLYAAGSRAAEAGKTAEEVSAIRKGVGFGESFGESSLGKGLQKMKTAKLGKEYAGKGWVDPNLQTGAGDVPIVAMDRRMHTIEGQKELMLQGKAPGLFKQTRKGGVLDPIEKKKEIGFYQQDDSLDAILQRQSASAKPSDKSLTSIGDFSDVPMDWEGVDETVSASDILSNKEAAMSKFFEDPKNIEGLGLGTGYDPRWGYRSSTWKPEAGTDLREFSDKYKTFTDTKMAGIPEYGVRGRDWASEIAELKSQEFQQSLGTIERLGLPGSSKSWQSDLF